MSEFLRYVLYELKNSLVLVLLAGVLAAAGLAVAFIVHKKKYKGQRKFPWGKVFLWLMFLGYLLIVIYATMLRWSGFFHREWNFHLFRAWKEAWNNYSVKNWANVLLNVAMFGPLGFLLPLMGKKFRKWYVTIPAGFGMSLAIELFQLAFGRGICDVDDLFCNTLGAVIGYFLIMTILSVVGEKGKRLKPSLVFGCLTFASVMAVCSVFIVYECKEYGNLPNAPAYTNNTSDTVWSLGCELPSVEGEIAVYKTQTRSIEECDAFGEEFRKLVGAEYTTISYYQEAAYYMDQAGDENGSHFLFVSYLDPSYEYHCGFGDDPVWVDGEREDIEKALAHLPVFIPEYADFDVEGNGWHTFTVEQRIDGAVMVDGTLRCRYAEDGTIREVQNNLLSYTYHEKVAVISPEEAFERLCDGKFNDGGFFEVERPHDVTVLSCKLKYRIDTKGFYQPVYLFELSSEDGSYMDWIMIPAMK